MIFSGAPFVFGFLPAMLLAVRLAWRLGGAGAAKAVLLAASLIFSACGGGAGLSVLGCSLLGNLALMRIVEGRRRVFAFGIAANLCLLGAFKYGFGGWLPLGISFFTFQQIMALAAAFRGEGFASALDYACFIAFFPHLIAGPLVRPADIAAQLRRFAPCVPLAPGLEMLALGLAKKLMFADPLGGIADPGFAALAAGHPLGLIEAWAALLAYALQLYFDFSGYADMAIGLAAMLGIAFPVNFASPYRAADIGDFWRRWNITLGLFLRDFVYIPLGGNRRSEGRRHFNLMATMLAGGIWHGDSWRFALWGALHGGFLVVHHAWRRAGMRLPAPLAWFLTLLAVVLAWVPFRAPSLRAMGAMYAALFGANGMALPDWLIAAVPALARIARGVPVLTWLGDARALALPEAALLIGLAGATALLARPLHRMGPASRGAALAASLAFVLQALLLAPAARPFLYFRF